MNHGNPFVRFVVDGKPVAKARPRFTRSGHVYTPDKTRKYEKKVRDQAQIEMFGKDILTDIGVDVYLSFFLAIPRSTSLKKKRWMMDPTPGRLTDPCPVPHIRKPDLDNLQKAALDSLSGVIFADDSMITSVYATKNWCWEGDERLEVEIHVDQWAATYGEAP